MNLRQQRKKLQALILPPLVRALIHLLWKTCRVRRVIGENHWHSATAQGQPVIPCYWHQQQIFCVRYLLDACTVSTDDAQPTQAIRLGYLISPSADGDMAASMFGRQGVRIIRGSATRGGAQALREIYTAIRQEGISPIVTPDGPTGPIYQFKPGVAMLSQLGKAPLVPMAYAASRVWKLRSWDQFMLPKPFSEIVIGIGEPLQVQKTDAADEFSVVCEQMSQRINRLFAECTAELSVR